MATNYVKHNWQNGEEGGTYIDAQKLNEMETGIKYGCDTADSATTKANNASNKADSASTKASSVEDALNAFKNGGIEYQELQNDSNWCIQCRRWGNVIGITASYNGSFDGEHYVYWGGRIPERFRPTRSRYVAGAGDSEWVAGHTFVGFIDEQGQLAVRGDWTGSTAGHFCYFEFTFIY